MSTALHQHLYDLWKKAGLIKGKKITESNRALEARVALLEAKIDNSSDEILFMDKSPKLTTEIILPLTEREAEPD